MFFCQTNNKNVEALKEILEKYERASGQAINKQKSAITFSRKANPDIKARVKRILELDKEGGVGKYLGLPEHFGRKKKDLFAAIIDKIQQKAINWSNKFLSSAGKMTLLKSVLSAIPVYTMSCFRLPTSLCKKIQSTLTHFWWDKNKDEKKMSWIAWKALTKRKNEGGLGFRDIQTFNNAMLAKISWRILENQNCLLARLLLGKYCQSQGFLEVEGTGTTSHGWRSILEGRKTLLENVGWVIGDGKKVNIWHDSWLSTTQQESPMGPAQEHLRDLTVAALIDPLTGDWCKSKIHEILPHYEKKIFSIKLSKKGAEDKIIWLKHYSGNYSVKSGYYLGTMSKSTNEVQTEDWNWNQNIWNATTGPKLKLFLWKAAKGALPTKERLFQRRILDNPVCSKCGEPESITHILFLCSYAKQVWKNAPMMNVPEIDEGMHFKIAWSLIKNLACLPPSGLPIPIAPWLAWNLWKARNNRDFNAKEYSSESTAIKALKEAKEWFLAQSPKTKAEKTGTTRFTEEVRDWITCKSDGAWNLDKKVAGLGWVFKEYERTIESRREADRFVSTALMAEGLALRAVMISALDRGFRQVIFESDSQQLLYAINKQTQISEMHGILHDIDVLRSDFVSLKFKLVKGAFVAEADLLAKTALSDCIRDLSVSS